MNERIKELILQAGFILDDDGNDFHVFNGYEAITCTKELKKFAQLIMQDMYEVMKAESEGFDLVGNFGAVQGIDVCMRKVKRHFGVKE